MNELDEFKVYLPALLILILQVLRVLYASPEFDGHGDASYKWDLARSLAAGDKSVFDPTSHHALRWGGWFLAYVFNVLFGDHLALYLLSTIIPSVLGSILFAFIVSRALGVLAGLVFVVVWMVDPQLYIATFKLMPTGSMLLPLALVILMLVNIAMKESISTTSLVVLAFLCFWLYGVKETNLFFVPAVLYILSLYRVRNSQIFIFIGIMIAFYAVEALILYAFTSLDHPFGRIYELLFGSAEHFNVMFDKKISNQVIQYYDGGISHRFYSGQAFHSIAYFVGAYLGLKILSSAKSEDKVDKYSLVVASLLLSFFFCTGFFIVGLDPLTLGQPLRTRYLVPMLPLAFILIGINVFKWYSSDNFRLFFYSHRLLYCGFACRHL